MKKRARARKRRKRLDRAEVQWHPKKPYRQVCLQNYVALGYSKSRALLICEGFESGRTAIPEKYPSPLARDPGHLGKPAGTIKLGNRSRDNTMSIIDRISDFLTGKKNAHARKVKRMMRKHPGMTLGEASKAAARVSNFADGARSRARGKSRARRRSKRTLKVCYCEKKYLANGRASKRCYCGAKRPDHAKRSRKRHANPHANCVKMYMRRHPGTSLGKASKACASRRRGR